MTSGRLSTMMPSLSKSWIIGVVSVSDMPPCNDDNMVTWTLSETYRLHCGFDLAEVVVMPCYSMGVGVIARR